MAIAEFEYEYCNCEECFCCEIVSEYKDVCVNCLDGTHYEETFEELERMVMHTFTMTEV